MSTFSKKYYSPKDSSKFLAVSWETGYKNVQIFYEGRLVHVIAQPGKLVNGIKIEDEELGTLKFAFSSSRPITLEIRVNNRKYKTVNKLNLGYDYSGLIAVFTTLAVFAGIENFIFGGVYEFDFSYPAFTLIFIIDFVFMALYIVTSYLLSKKKPWVYFIGGILFLLTTLFSTIGFTIVFSAGANGIFLILRYGILIYIILQGRHIIKELGKSSSSKASEDLLDNL